MDAVLRNLNAIPCPSGDGCTEVGCLLQHNRDSSSAGGAPGQARSHGLDANRGLDSKRGFAADDTQDATGPRKRPKVASGSERLLSQSQPLTATKPVSPPPVKRKLSSAHSHPNPITTASPSNQKTSSTTPFGGKNPFASPITTASPKSSTVANSATGIKATRPPAVPSNRSPVRKPEALNPRHLKSSAPTSHENRVKLLNALHEQLQRLNNELKKSSDPGDKKLVFSPQELIWLALDKEVKFATVQPSLYLNRIKSDIYKHKKLSVSDWRKELIEENKKKQEALSAASGKLPQNSNMGPPVTINTGLDSDQEVQILKYLLTPIRKLAQHGYVPVAPTAEEIAKARAGEEASLGFEECDRCKSRFQAFPGRREDGVLTTCGPCKFHPGRLYYTERSAGQTGPGERKYRCCDQPMGEPGCDNHEHHVFKVTAPSRLAALIPFAETPPNSDVPEERAICFDCEMGYTTRGMELIRLTATRFPEGSEILDVLVTPIGEVLDLNSRYSGVLNEHILDAVKVDDPMEARRIIQELEEKDQAGAKTGSGGGGESSEGRTMKKRMQMVSSPMVARALLFAIIAPETPLIGHGLENDLNAMRIVHPTIIDTILLYPHPKGLPVRNGLKALARQHLNKDIQVVGAGVVGHDSGEDARAAGDLVRLKVAQKWKDMLREGWALNGGKIVLPQRSSRSASDPDKWMSG
ncbi:hypothetical protein B0T16DRAFT_109293 [Cercophora newfieldiana]|uniref:Exonuclease domain-containing protein n=1 Tax=Cercophora newfieldiana TaxID=92897 RepID=A0AA39YL37_9PEZI|nr:hypothetical protein B0T16DRAFT_109293 [Cercophora newfieldiana]